MRFERLARTPESHDRDLFAQVSREKTLRNHGVDAAHYVHNLSHPKTGCDAAQSVSVGLGETGSCREKIDSVARRESHGQIQVLVESDRDPVRTRLRHRPSEILLP